MGIAEIKDHLRCFNYNQSNKPMIETVKIVKDYTDDVLLTYSQVVFIMEGRIDYTSTDFLSCETTRGHILFFPAGARFSYRTLEKSLVIILRIENPIRLCKNTSLEDLYSKNSKVYDNPYVPKTKSLGKLEMNARVLHYLFGIKDSLADGLKCQCWMEMKIKEFFILLRVYYYQDQIYDFLFLILSNDTSFSEQVRLHWRSFKTVAELAEHMNYSPKQFNARFKTTFGQTPNHWLMEARATLIYDEIVSTTKQFKQIAMEHGFTSDSSFTRFCKLKFEKTPSQIRSKKKNSGAE